MEAVRRIRLATCGAARRSICCPLTGARTREMSIREACRPAVIAPLRGLSTNAQPDRKDARWLGGDPPHPAPLVWGDREALGRLRGTSRPGPPRPPPPAVCAM